MKESEVPQDERNFREGNTLHKLVYATDTSGKYVGKVSAGWAPENEATKQAWEDVEDRLQETIAQVKSGALSPIAYYMEKTLMDVSLLAKYMGKWAWQVKNHLKPTGFKKLSTASIKRYADVFNISVEELQEPKF